MLILLCRRRKLMRKLTDCFEVINIFCNINDVMLKVHLMFESGVDFSGIQE